MAGSQGPSVIELSNSAATRVFAPGDYECSIVPPKVVNAGDQLYVRLAAVDGALPVGQIILENDLLLTLSYYLYEYDVAFGGAQDYRHYFNQGDIFRPPVSSYLPYLAMYNSVPIERSALIILPAGGYSPAGLAEIITKLCVTPTFEPPPAVPGFQPEGCGLAAFSPLMYQMPFAVDESGEVWSSVRWTRLEAPDGSMSGNIEPRDQYIYQLGSVDTPILPSTYLMSGALQFSLTYDEGGCAAFRFSYAHTPVMNPNDAGGAPVVAEIHQVTTDQFPLPPGSRGIHRLTRAAGIMFTNLEPRSFWEDTLGFDLGLGDDGLASGEGILVRFVQGGPGPTFSPQPKLVNLSERRHMTFNIYGSADRLTSGSRMYSPTTGDNVGPVFHASDATWPISAKQWFAPDTTPLYLVELTGGPPTEYQANGSTFRAIAAVVSKTWSESNFVVSYADSALPYVHASAVPLLISSIRVRILDAITKNVSRALGDNSVVLLSIMPGAALPAADRSEPATGNGQKGAAAISHEVAD